MPSCVRPTTIISVESESVLELDASSAHAHFVPNGITENASAMPDMLGNSSDESKVAPPNVNERREMLVCVISFSLSLVKGTHIMRVRIRAHPQA